MNAITKNNCLVNIFIFAFGVLVLIPATTLANSTYVYQEIRTSSATGGTIAGTSNVEIQVDSSNESGSYSYEFSTTTAGNVTQLVEIENGVPTLVETDLVNPWPGDFSSTTLAADSYETWLMKMTTLIKYLLQYVEQNF